MTKGVILLSEYMTKEILEAGPVQKGLNPEKLAEVLSVGWHKFVAEKRGDGSIGPMMISTRDWGQSRVFPKHSAIAEICGLAPNDCIGGVAKWKEDGSWELGKTPAMTVGGAILPEQFEEAVRISNEQGYTIVSI